VIVQETASRARLQRRACMVAMIFGGVLAVTPVFGPLRETLHWLDDFVHERPQSMRGPDLSFYVELLALIACPIGFFILALSLIFYLRAGRRAP
jgi:hypothetical protein